MTPIKGAFISHHQFGRSRIVRSGTSLYYIVWQAHPSKTEFTDTYFISKVQYNKIKSMLGAHKTLETQTLSDNSAAATYFHPTSSKLYMRIKRYLYKQNILKKEDRVNGQ